MAKRNTNKKIIIINISIKILLLLFFSFLKSQNDLSNFSLRTTTTWYEYTLSNSTSHSLDNGKLALTEQITLRNKQPIHLKKLKLKWNGEQINDIYASLYTKKESQDELVPIEENLICDGFWNQGKQQLIFDINKKLVSLNKFYLVLRFPDQIEEKLKKGNFSVLEKLNPNS